MGQALERAEALGRWEAVACERLIEEISLAEARHEYIAQENQHASRLAAGSSISQDGADSGGLNGVALQSVTSTVGRSPAQNTVQVSDCSGVAWPTAPSTVDRGSIAQDTSESSGGCGVSWPSAVWPSEPLFDAAASEACANRPSEEWPGGWAGVGVSGSSCPGIVDPIGPASSDQGVMHQCGASAGAATVPAYVPPTESLLSDISWATVDPAAVESPWHRRRRKGAGIDADRPHHSGAEFQLGVPPPSPPAYSAELAAADAPPPPLAEEVSPATVFLETAGATTPAIQTANPFDAAFVGNAAGAKISNAPPMVFSPQNPWAN